MHYTSGQVQQATPPFLYGTIDVRAKAPGGIGTWPAIWMLGFEWQASQPFTANTPEHQWPKAGWCEIDIAEFWRGERDEVNTTVHYNEPGGLHLQSLPFDATERFMVYRLQWTPGSLVWSVDAEDGEGFRELRSVSGSDNVPNVPMYLVIHTAIGGIGRRRSGSRLVPTDIRGGLCPDHPMRTGAPYGPRLDRQESKSGP